MPQHIGRRMRRVEDERLITGRGRFAGDIKPDGLTHIAFARSPVPHARITAIDTSAAKALPGVIAVWTAADLPELAVEMSDFKPPDIDGPGRPVINGDEVNYVGEAFAVVVAETLYQAYDAAQAVFADLDPLPGVGDVESAVAPGAGRVHEGSRSNVALTQTIGYGDIDKAFDQDAVSASIRLTTARVAGAAMEPRTVTAAPDPATGGLTVWTSTQNVFGVREAIASVAGLKSEKVRVMAEDVGGGFGAKGSA
ncbi:MAG TPA: molybdopterin cofactor-binding domain-containing protein, partial [Patescibacteria group bacterium]|nr:molybdopterin cofactor-binding domain-containing protein [Patescibacteria group bacterium]